MREEFGEPLTIKGDSKSLRNLMVNLITNATRYTAKGGIINVSLYREGSMAVVAVSDTGMAVEAPQKQQGEKECGPHG